jgi:hypothetical protein
MEVVMTLEYAIGAGHMRGLSTITDLSESELAAIYRLYDFRGSREDVEVCIRLYESIGEHGNAKHLRDLIAVQESPIINTKPT